MIDRNGIELCTEPFGDLNAPPILLIMGIGSSMLWWEEDLCRKLADGGRFVIRYDHRDTGRSTTYDPGRPGYAASDLVADATGVLDAYDIAAAHVVGVSAGGAFAQLLALDYPDRVLSLVLISTSPATPTDRELPPPTEEFGRFASDAARGLVRCRLGTRLPRRLFARPRGRPTPVRRGGDSRPGAPGHRARPQTSRRRRTTMCCRRASPRRSPCTRSQRPPSSCMGPRIRCSRSSTARPSREEIPGARLLRLEGAGHGVDRADWDRIIPAILAHTAA